MDNRDLGRRRMDGYFEGASGRTSQFDFDDEDFSEAGASGHSYGDEARWKNSSRAAHYSDDVFGRGHRDRTWSKNLDNRRRDGLHFGKGPKNYQRSDERIREDICEALTHSHMVDPSNIDISVQDGIVTLAGTVESRRMKRAAEDVIDTISGVEDIINLVSLIGETKADKMDTSGSPLGGNPDQKSKTGNWP